MLPVIQFSDVDDFIWETKNRPCDGTCRVWPGEWNWTTSDKSPVAWMYKGVVAQALVLDPAGRVAISVVMLSVVIGCYQMIYGRPFGPEAERRQAIIQEYMQDAKKRLVDYFGDRLNANWRIAPGSIVTGLTGQEITNAYWDSYEDIYAKLRKEATEKK